MKPLLFVAAVVLLAAGGKLAGGALLLLVCVGVLAWAFGGKSPMRAGRAVSVRGHGHGDRSLIAKHEAGHAAAARALGGRVRSARLWDDGGLVQANIPDGPEAAVTFLLAGKIAAGTSRGASADDAAVRRELRGLPGAEKSRIRRDATREAHRIVSRHSGQIRRDAARLDRDGRL